MEEWRKIRCYPTTSFKQSDYSISHKGRIRNDITGDIVGQRVLQNGKPIVTIKIGRRHEDRMVAHLVAQEFLSYGLVQITRVDYVDENPSNCHVDNIILEHFRARKSRIWL